MTDHVWRPIATAPRDGKPVLLSFGEGTPAIAHWNGRGGWDDGDFYDHMEGFTHWMPLPAPPEQPNG